MAAPIEVVSPKVRANEGSKWVAWTCVQCHGAIDALTGYSKALYYRRAKVGELDYVNTDCQLEMVTIEPVM